MPDVDARFHISLREGTFDVSGSEAFVQERIKQYGDVIGALLKKMQELPSTATPLPAPPAPLHRAVDPAGGTNPDTAAPGGTTVADTYPNVYSISEGQIHIIADLPGKTTSDKSVAAAMLYLLAKESSGQKKGSFKEIQAVCKAHGCLDTTNFASHLRGAKKDVIVSGTRGALEAELTVPGRKAAQTLAQSLNGE